MLAAAELAAAHRALGRSMETQIQGRDAAVATTVEFSLAAIPCHRPS